VVLKLIKTVESKLIPYIGTVKNISPFFSRFDI